MFGLRAKVAVDVGSGLSSDCVPVGREDRDDSLSAGI